MKYLFITDVHGDGDAIEKVLSYKEKDNWNKIIILGDLLYHGPRNPIKRSYDPLKVVELLKPLKEDIIWIKGNCDAEVDETVMEMNAFVSISLKLNGIDCLLTHGHHTSRHNPDESLKKGSVVFYGHYHVNDYVILNDVKYINLSSISLPKDNHKTFAILEDNVFSIYKLEDHSLIKEIKI